MVRLVDQRTELVDRIERVPGPPVRRPGQDPVEQFVPDPFVDDQPGRGRAVLSHVPEGAGHEMLGHHVQILRSFEHHERVLAAALQGDLLEVGVRGVTEEPATGLGRSRESDHIHVHVSPQRLPDPRSRTGDHVEDTVRHSGLHCQLGQAQSGERRLLGGFQNHRVPGGQGRADLPGGDEQREVPRKDRTHHTDRLPHDDRHGLVADRRRLVIHLVDELGMPLDGVDGLRHVYRVAVPGSVCPTRCSP